MKTRWVILIILTIIIILLLLLNSIGIININTSSHGHGDTRQGTGTSILISLGILEDYDYIDKFTDETYCFDDECWDTADALYGACLAEFGDDPRCEDEYMDYLISECSVRCEEETYIWDGTPVNDLGTFSQTAFPDFTSNSETSCESWWFGGEWISQPDKVGCVDAWSIPCNTNSKLSAKAVCETIGKTWTCNSNEAFCSG